MGESEAAALFEGHDLHVLSEKIPRNKGYQFQRHWLQVFALCEKCR